MTDCELSRKPDPIIAVLRQIDGLIEKWFNDRLGDPFLLVCSDLEIKIPEIKSFLAAHDAQIRAEAEPIRTLAESYENQLNEIQEILLEHGIEPERTKCTIAEAVENAISSTRAEAVAGAIGAAARAVKPFEADGGDEIELAIRALTDKDAENWLAREIAKARLEEHEMTCRNSTWGTSPDYYGQIICGTRGWICERRAELERAESGLADKRGERA